MKRTAQHSIAAIGMFISLIIAANIWLQYPSSDLWSRRWLLVVMPFLSGIALLISWRHVWQDVALGIVTTYFLAPLIAARIESCFLPIDNAVPCFADVNQVRVLADQLGHPVYYPGLIVLHVIGIGATWWYISHKGGVDAPARQTTA